ncbi:hypothetical protein [Jannaschia aquimarina]|uniref:Uncharacterized protein n=1 Tax=Jannaschia aquimarina TaxID=935700 RepID=A0A0D1EC28_9RHOB|nr:hypothetical protein [Jannaschia aquimarina]KIT14446.1 hypothetical protein jaqu_37340 [Jannaschia aquimarina]SNT29265.1 hypothetical protein SAMN05421775_11065 [Jannaschia aquimarina]
MTLRPLGPALWLAEGPTIRGAAGFRFPTRMAILEAEDALVAGRPHPRPGRSRRAAGPGPAHHIASVLHRTWIGTWRDAAPDAILVGAPGVIDADLTVGDGPVPGHPDLEAVLFPNKIATEAVLLHAASRTVVFTDLVQQMPPGWYRGWRAIVARLDRMTGPEPAVPRKFRLATRDRPGARAALARILNFAPQRLVAAHAPPIERDAKAHVERLFAWL